MESNALEVPKLFEFEEPARTVAPIDVTTEDNQQRVETWIVLHILRAKA